MTSRLRFHSSLLLGVAAALFLLPQVGRAQAIDKAEAPAVGAASGSKGHTVATGEAKASALRANGLVRDPLTGEMMVGGVLYIKIAPGYDPLSTALALGMIGGLEPLEASVCAAAAFLPIEPVRTKTRKSSGRTSATEQVGERLRALIELRYETSLSPREAAERLRGMGGVEYAEPIMVPHLLGPNDPLLGEQYHLPMIHALQAWNLWRGDTATIIGVVDAGIDNTHPDLIGSIAVNPGESGTDGSGQDRRTNNMDDDGNGVVDDWRGANLAWEADGTLPSSTRGSAHGTQVSGLAAATPDNGIGIAGTGYNCRLIPVKAASNVSGYLTYAYEGMIYCAVRGCRVINCSFGSNAYSQAEQEIVNAVIGTYNCSIVAAGGNDYTYGGLYPAAYRGVLGVGAIDTAGVYRTTWGEHIDLAAPTGTSTNDGNSYTPLGPATSYTTPVVSGALALIRSRWPQLNALQAAAHVRWACDSITGLPVALRDYTGAGRLNMERALAVDPFVHPAVALDSVVLLDTTGAMSEEFVQGERGALRFLLHNLLGSATGLKVRARIVGEDTAFVRCDSNWVTVGDLPTGAVRQSGPIPFHVLRRSSTPLRVRLEMVADGGYRDGLTTGVRFSVPYITVQTAELRVSLADAGRIGTDGIPGSTGGGLQYRGTSTLFEGGVMMGTDADHVVSNIRHDDGQPDNALLSTEHPSSTNGGIARLSDSAAGTRAIGLELAMRLLVNPAVNDAFGLELVVRNARSTPIDTLRVAMFADWDLGGRGDGQTVHLGTVAADGIGHYGVIEDQEGEVVTHGLAAPSPTPIFVAMRNDSVVVDSAAGLALSLFDGFTGAEKWWTLSHGLAIDRAGSGKSGESDISLVIGRSLLGLDIGTRDTLLFVFGFGGTETLATEAMERFLQKGSSEVVSPADDAGFLSLPFPQPANDRCIVQVRGSGKLQLFDAAGREVADFSKSINGNQSGRFLLIDTRTLPSGRYQLSFSNAGERSVRSLVIAR